MLELGFEHTTLAICNAKTIHPPQHHIGSTTSETELQQISVSWPGLLWCLSDKGCVLQVIMSSYTRLPLFSSLCKTQVT